MWFFVFLLLFYRAFHCLGEEVTEEEYEASDLVPIEDIISVKTDMENLHPGYGTKWIIMPNGDGEPDIATLNYDQRDYTEQKFFKINKNELSEKVILKFYTKDLPEGKLLDPNDFEIDGFDPKKSTKFIIHGWMADSNSSVIVGIRDAYLQNQDVNVITVDWSEISGNYLYTIPAGATKVVGEYLADAIDSLVYTTGTRHENIHFVGHSLGAHIAGFAGNYTKEKLGRITGLDPALPGFQFFRGREDRLDDTDADFVDVIHTCAGILGMSRPTGHADFYPNGGSPLQPGCQLTFSNLSIGFPQICSHSRAHQYFAESIGKALFRAVSCNNWDFFKKNKCKDNYANMGEYVSRDTTGIFYLRTNSAMPFSLGENGVIY